MPRLFRVQAILVAGMVWLFAASILAAQDVVVSPDTGGTDKTIQDAIDAVNKAGGGRVVLKPGEYVLHRGLILQNARGVSIIGGPGVRLKFAPEVCVVAAADAPKGQDFVEVESAAGVAEGMHLEIQAQGRLEITPSGSKYQVTYFDATAAAIEGNKITMRRPLEYAVPKGAKMLNVYNAFTLGGGTANVTIEGLEIDLNRDQWPVKPINHTCHCAVLGSGAYDHKRGVAGSLVESVVIRNCAIRNCHHRGIAWYGVVRSSVIGCRIENTGAEAIDFDHFCFNCEARDNDIRNAPSGVELNDASNCIVENNRMDGCENGIIVWRWFDGDDLNVGNVFRSNQITNSKKAGIACETRTGKTTITGNTIQGSRGKGILVGGDENRIEQNTVRGCAKEAILVSGNRNVLRGNDCKDGQELLKNVGRDNVVQ
jgi:parallel beta-helix repeat protein